jgi:surface protein
MATVFAVYWNASKRLQFYNRDSKPTVGQSFEGDKVSAVYTGFDTAVYDSVYGVPWSSIRRNIYRVAVIDSFAPLSMAYWFEDMELVGTIDISVLDTSKVVSMKNLFKGCTRLGTLVGLSNLNTSNVTDMSRMFSGCVAIKELDLTTLDTHNVTNMSYMCNNCAPKINMSNLDASNVTDMSGMFSGSRLRALDITNMKTDKVNNMEDMFYNCYHLTELIGLSTLNTSNVVNMRYMFRMSPPAGTKSELAKLDLSNFDTHNVTTTEGMFRQSGLTELDVSSFDTSNITNMSEMFSYCDFTTLDLSNFNTSNVTNMMRMFYACKATTLDISNFDTTSAPDITGLFYYCSRLTTVKLPKFNNVTSLASLFYECSSLTTVDLSDLDTSSVTSMSNMFYECDNLTTVDFSGLNTSNVTNMSYMFYGCNSLNMLDLSDFDTSNVTNMNYMFYKCSNLTTIYVSEKWSVASIASANNSMFYACSSLSGVIPYDASKTDATMANYENGYLVYAAPKVIFAIYSETDNSLSFYKRNENTKPIIGSMFEEKMVSKIYVDFKDAEYSEGEEIPWVDSKNDILKIFFVDKIVPITTAYWFDNCINLNNIELVNLNTKKVINMSNMFNNCSSLIEIDLTNLDTSNVTNMSNMFNNCSKVNLLDLTNLNTASVTNMDSMFGNCAELKSIYVDKDKWSTEKVISSANMFSNCNKLSGAISYDSTKLDSTYANTETGYLKLEKDWLISVITMEKLANAVRKVTKTEGKLYPHEMIELLNNVGIKVAHDGEGRVAVDISIADISYDENGVVRIN